MYKNMYNSTSKTSLLLLPYAIILVEIQGENEQKQEDGGIEETYRQQKTRKLSNFNFFKTGFFFLHILRKSSHSLSGGWSFLLAHIRFTPNEGPKSVIN